MQIEILTIFPEYFRTPLQESLLGKATQYPCVECHRDADEWG